MTPNEAGIAIKELFKNLKAVDASEILPQPAKADQRKMITDEIEKLAKIRGKQHITGTARM
jgi:hypothetical protein